jgi:hypothetical protein
MLENKDTTLTGNLGHNSPKYAVSKPRTQESSIITP